MAQLTVSKVAEQVGASADTLRYYERIGLLPAPDRSSSGYRLYGADAVDTLLFIKRAQRLGLRLEEIRELLAIRARGLCPCGRTRRLLEQRVAQLDEEMEAIAHLRDDIRQMLDEGTPPEGGGWERSEDLIQIRPTRPRSRRTKGGER